MTEPDEGLPPLSADTLPLYLPLYVDGALDQADRGAVEDLMKDNPEAEEILRLLDHAVGQDMRLTLVDGADHRFSDDNCLALIKSSVEEVLALATLG